MVKQANAWQRWIIRHLHQATTPQDAQDVVNGVLRNYFVSREEVLFFISELNKQFKKIDLDDAGVPK